MKKRRRLVPLMDANEEWVPIKVPCILPELNRDGPEPLAVLFVELGAGKEHAIRLTADECDELSRDLAARAADIRSRST